MNYRHFGDSFYINFKKVMHYLMESLDSNSTDSTIIITILILVDNDRLIGIIIIDSRINHIYKYEYEQK